MKRTKNEFMNQVAIATANALRSPEILRALAEHGISEAQLKKMQSEWHLAQQLNHQYQDAAVEAKAATQSLREVRTQAQQMYRQHVVLSRVALANQPVLLEKMRLNGPRERAIAAWTNQAQSFYRHAPAVKDTLAKFNITTRELSEMQKFLDRTAEVQKLQFQLKGRMQVISEQRKQAYATLQASVSKLFRIARIALEDEPQHLEMLGIVVKAVV